MSQKDNKLVAEVRTNFGKGFARRLRAAGKIPAVIYGRGSEPQHVALPGHETMLIIRKANALLELEVEGKQQLALVKDVQKDPVRQIIEHIDLILVIKGEKVEVEIPVHIEGESFSGTIVDHETTTLKLEVEATDIPENVVINVDGLTDGTKIHAKDVTLPKGAVLVDDPELLLVAINVPTVSAEDAAADAAEAAAAAE